jgi:DoxX-like protein
MQTTTHDHWISETILADSRNKPVASSRAAWAGRLLSSVAVLFLAVDSGAKLLQAQAAIDGTLQLGYPRHIVFTLGVILLSCVITYVVPRTSVLGAVLLTAYLGGAVATHVRVDNPLFSHVLFPVYIGALLWGGLMLRDPRLRAVFPIRSAS